MQQLWFFFLTASDEAKREERGDQGGTFHFVSLQRESLTNVCALRRISLSGDHPSERNRDRN